MSAVLQVNRATEMILENLLHQLADCDNEHPGRHDAGSVYNYFMDSLEDFADCYDEEWYALVGTSAIADIIDWNYIAMKANEYEINRED
jgi:hypothetical protein